MSKLFIKLKHDRKIRLLLVLIIVAIYCNNAFSAIVSDNDGSAFVTKAEFEAMKTSFSKQISDYQSSITNKIDGAIASYLAGIKVTKTEVADNLINKGYDKNIANTSFMKYADPESTKNPIDCTAGFYYTQSAGVCSIDTTKYYGGCIVCNSAGWSGGMGLIRYTNYTGNTANFTSRYIWINKKKETDTVWRLQDYIYHRLHFDLQVVSANMYGASLDYDFGVPTTYNPTSTFSLSQPGTVYQNIDGKGAYRMTQTHVWENVGSKEIYGDATKMLNLERYKYQVSKLPNVSLNAVYYDKRDVYDTSVARTQAVIQKDKPTTAAYDGSKSGMENGISNSTKGNSNNLSFWFKWYKQKEIAVNMQNLESEYWNTIMGQVYYKYYGVPITYVTSPCTLEFTLEVNSTKGKPYTYCIKDTQFGNSETLPSTEISGGHEHVLKYETNVTSNKIKLKLEKEFMTNKQDYIYIKVIPSDSADLIKVKTDGEIKLTRKD